MAGRRVVAFAGLGRPQGFAETLTAAGAEIVARRWYADHHPYSSTEVQALVDEAVHLDAVPVTTGKDAVKLPADVAVWVVEVEAVPSAGSWDSLWRLVPGIAGER